MSMTYNSLLEQIENYLDRNDQDTIDQIPNFISQAEQRICRESKNIGLEVYVTSTFTPTQSVYPKPGRWRRTISFNYGTGPVGLENKRNQIQLRSYEFVRNYWPNSTETGAPLYYCDYGYTNFLVSPTPDLAYPFELAYLELPQPLSFIVQTNWLTNYAPDILLYGALLESAPYLKTDERIPVWQKYYDRALNSLNHQDDMRTTDRNSYRESD